VQVKRMNSQIGQLPLAQGSMFPISRLGQTFRGRQRRTG
jgi:hypothetical protein